MAKIPYTKEEVYSFYQKTKETYERSLSAQEYDLSGLGVKRASISQLKKDLLYWSYCRSNLEAGINVELVEEYRKRIIQTSRTVRTRGNVNYYIAWAQETEGVGRYALPAHSTETPPPQLKPGQVAIWVRAEEDEFTTEGEWQVQEDHRGETVYDTATGEPLTVDYIGEIKSEHTEKKPGRFQRWDGESWVDRELTPEEKDLIIAEGMATIDTENQSKIFDGFTYNNKIFSMSLSAQINWDYLLTIYTGGQFPDEGYPIATKDDNEYMLTKDEAAATFKATLLAKGEERKKN